MQLWHDKTQKKGKGAWYADPVYYFDIPAIQRGTYKPLKGKASTARINWEEISNYKSLPKPFRLYSGDVIEINGVRARFNGIHVGTIKLSFNDLRTKEEQKNIPTFGKWNNTTEVKIIQEDCLGHCHLGYTHPTD